MKFKSHTAQYTWLCSWVLWMGTTVCYAQKEENELKDAQFVIEKHKKNKINPASKLFFKAPAQIVKSEQQPLAMLQALAPYVFPLDPVAEILSPFPLKQAPFTVSLPSYLNFGLLNMVFPFMELTYYPSFLRRQEKGVGYLHATYAPFYWHGSRGSPMVAVEGQGKFTIGAWLFYPALQYQYDSYRFLSETKPSYPSMERSIQQIAGTLRMQHAHASAAHAVQIAYDWLACQNKKNKEIGEKCLVAQYKGIKRLENYALHVKVYGNIAAHHCSAATAPLRGILSLRPGITVDFPKAVQLKISIKGSYHNAPIANGDVQWQLYPTVLLKHATISWLNPYITIQGLGNAVQPLHLRDIVTKDPFITDAYTVKHYSKGFHFQLGSRGELLAMRTLSYHIYMAYSHFNNLPEKRRASANQSHLYALYYKDELQKLWNPTAILYYNDPRLNIHMTLKLQSWLGGKEIATGYLLNKPNRKVKFTTAYQVAPKCLLTAVASLYGMPPLRAEGDSGAVSREPEVGFEGRLSGSYAFAASCSAYLTVRCARYPHKFAHYKGRGYGNSPFSVSAGVIYKW
ncbi:MAG: hypothetical protein NQ127_00095 [Candidatus Cardinium sp.]|nr:hypothetical protein [Candidatus Cardinium sp.]